MTEYDYSPEAYDRYLATQNRIANWVDKTEQHRPEFQSANKNSPDLSRSGPGPASYANLARYSPPPSRQHPGQSQPRQRIIHPLPPESESSSSSDTYYEGQQPAPMHRPSPSMQMQQSPPPMMTPPALPHTTPHHHRHRSHHHRRSRSRHSPAYYTVATPPPSPAYPYPGVNQGYAQIPVVSNSSQTPRSVPSVQPTSYFQPQHGSAFLASNSQPSSPQLAWPAYGAHSPGYPVMSTPTGFPLQSPAFPRVPTYQPFVIQQSSPLSYRIPHKRVYNLSKP